MVNLYKSKAASEAGGKGWPIKC